MKDKKTPKVTIIMISETTYQMGNCSISLYIGTTLQETYPCPSLLFSMPCCLFWTETTSHSSCLNPSSSRDLENMPYMIFNLAVTIWFQISFGIVCLPIIAHFFRTLLWGPSLKVLFHTILNSFNSFILLQPFTCNHFCCFIAKTLLSALPRFQGLHGNK